MDWGRVKRAIETYRRCGSKEVLSRLCSYGIVPSCTIEYAAYDLYRLKTFRRVPNRSDTSITVGFASGSDVFQLSMLTTESKSPNRRVVNDLFEKFMAQNGRCVAVRAGEQIVGYEWLFRNRYFLSLDELGPRTLEFRLGEGVFLSNGYILPDYRLKGLFPLMANFIVNSFSESTPVYTHIKKNNRPSKLAHERLGFEPIGEIEFWRLAGLSHFWVISSPRKRTRIITRSRPVTLGDLFAEIGVISGPVF